MTTVNEPLCGHIRLNVYFLCCFKPVFGGGVKFDQILKIVVMTVNEPLYGQNSVKNESIHLYKYNITFIDKYFIEKKTTKLYNEAEVDSTSKSTGYIKLLQF